MPEPLDKPGYPRSENAKFKAEIASTADNLCLVFTHVPDFKDPYLLKHSANKDCTTVPKPFPHSGCDTRQDVPGDEPRDWEASVTDKRVVGVFAGHFHDSDRLLYARRASETPLAP